MLLLLIRESAKRFDASSLGRNHAVKPYSIQYEFTDEIATQAAAAYIPVSTHKLDAKFWKGFFALLVCNGIGGVAVALVSTVTLDWRFLLLPVVFLVFFGGLLALLLSLQLFIWATTWILPLGRWNVQRLMMKPFRDLGDRTVRWLFTEEKFEVHLVNRDREVSWSKLKRLRIYSNFWALELKGGPTLMLPEAFTNAEIQALIRRKALEVGAKVVEAGDAPQH
jgi:hypothetical protein